MQDKIDAFKVAVAQDDPEAMQAAAINLGCGALLLLERAVVALETLAEAVDTYDRPTTVRTRSFG